MNLDMYLEKHTAINGELSQLKTLAEKEIDETAAARLSDHINKLTAVLLMHLSSEDKYLYPALLAAPDANVKTMTRQYMQEMGDISGKYSAFKTRYNTPSKILSDPSGFKTELAALYATVTARIRKEESELYQTAAKL